MVLWSASRVICSQKNGKIGQCFKLILRASLNAHLNSKLLPGGKAGCSLEMTPSLGKNILLTFLLALKKKKIGNNMFTRWWHLLLKPVCQDLFWLNVWERFIRHKNPVFHSAFAVNVHYHSRTRSTLQAHLTGSLSDFYSHPNHRKPKMWPGSQLAFYGKNSSSPGPFDLSLTFGR